jgi:hypothetical protein
MVSIIKGYTLPILLTVVIMLNSFFAVALGRWEGMQWPVVSDVSLEIGESVYPSSVRITGTFEKVRECEFVKSEFRLGMPGNSILLDVTYEEPSKVRGTGLWEYGPWVVNANQQQMEYGVFTEVHHSCHIMFDTITRFYPQRFVDGA